MVTLLRRIQPPLGFGKLCPHRVACKVGFHSITTHSHTDKEMHEHDYGQKYMKAFVHPNIYSKFSVHSTNFTFDASLLFRASFAASGGDEHAPEQ